jgi:hypothetical protein
MSCPLDAELSAFLDGELVTGRDRRMRAHLVACQRCREALEALSTLRQSLGTLPTLAAPEKFDELWRRVKEAETVRPRLFDRLINRLAGARWALGIVGAGLVGALLIAPRLRHSTGLSDDEIVVDAERAFRHADLEYQGAVAKLKMASTRTSRRLVEDERQKFEAALSELESATERCRQVAHGRPADPEAEELLFSAYRRQIRFFEDQLLAAGSR